MRKTRWRRALRVQVGLDLEGSREPLILFKKLDQSVLSDEETEGAWPGEPSARREQPDHQLHTSAKREPSRRWETGLSSV